MSKYEQNATRREVQDVPMGHGHLKVYTTYVENLKISEVFTLMSMASVLGLTPNTLLGRYRRTNLQHEVLFIPTGTSRPQRGFALHTLATVREVLLNPGAHIGPKILGAPSTRGVNSPLRAAVETFGGGRYFTVERLAQHFGLSISSVRNKLRDAGMLALSEAVEVPLFGGRPKKGYAERYATQLSAILGTAQPVPPRRNDTASPAHRPTNLSWLNDELTPLTGRPAPATDEVAPHEDEPTLPQTYIAADGSVKVRYVAARVVQAARDRDDAQHGLTQMLAELDSAMANSIMPDLGTSMYRAPLREVNDPQSIQQNAREQIPGIKSRFLREWHDSEADAVLQSGRPVLAQIPQLDVESLFNDWRVERDALQQDRAEAVQRSNDALNRELSALVEYPGDDEWNVLVNAILAECGVGGDMAPIGLIGVTVAKYRKRLLDARKVAERIGTNLLGKAKAGAEAKEIARAKRKPKAPQLS